MAVKPYQEAAVWSFRLRIKGHSIYRTGFKSSAEALKESERLRQNIINTGKPKHDGPWQTTLAKALQLYGLERLPFLKGARQEKNRINRYLRAAGLETLDIKGVTDSPSVYCTVQLQPPRQQRVIPNGLHQHRAQQSESTARTEALIRQFAKTPVAKLANYQLQELIDAMQCDGYEAATIGLERALLRRLFNYARKTWRWPEPARNPATHLTMPVIDNARDRVLTNAEWGKISAELNRLRNPYVPAAIALLLESAMRISEPLLHATWNNVDWDSQLLHLTNAKAGARSVPLSPGATEILRTLLDLRGNDDSDLRILPITYEAIKAAWNRACTAAKITDVHIHDLRHTAATRFTLALNGNLPILKVITGHKTYSQLSRYINVKPADVSRLLHGRPMTEDDAPAGLHPFRAELISRQDLPADEGDLPHNVALLRRTNESRLR